MVWRIVNVGILVIRRGNMKCQRCKEDLVALVGSIELLECLNCGNEYWIDTGELHYDSFLDEVVD